MNSEKQAVGELIVTLHTDEIASALEMVRQKRAAGLPCLVLGLTDHICEQIEEAGEPAASFLEALHGDDLMALAERTIRFVKEWPKRDFQGNQFRKRFAFDGLYLWWFAEGAFYGNIVNPIFVFEGFRRFLESHAVGSVTLFGPGSLKHEAVKAAARQEGLECHVVSKQSRVVATVKRSTLQHRILKLTGLYYHLRSTLQRRPRRGGLLFFSHQRFGFTTKKNGLNGKEYLLDHRFAGFFDRLLEEGEVQVAMVGCEVPEVAGLSPSASLRALIGNGQYPYAPLEAFYRPDILQKTREFGRFLDEFWRSVAADQDLRRSLDYEGSAELGRLFLEGLKRAIYGTANQYRYFLLIDAALQRRQPEIALLAQPDIALLAACRIRGIPSIFVQHGIVTDFAKLSDIPAVTYLPFYLEDADEVAAGAGHLYPAPTVFAVWGEGVKDFFLRHGYPRQVLAVTGYPGNDLFSLDDLSATRAELSSLGVDFSRKIVTFFTTYYTRDPDTPFSCFFVGDSTLVARFETVVRTVRDYLRANTVALQLVVKLHQCDDNLASYRKIAAKYDVDVLFLKNIEASAVIACSDICISPISSVIVSIALAGKPLLIVDDTDLPQDTFYQRATFASFSFDKAKLGAVVYRKLEELQAPCDMSSEVTKFVEATIGDQNATAYSRLTTVVKRFLSRNVLSN